MSRYLNVKYGNEITLIKVEPETSLGELQDAIKTRFGDEIPAPPIRIHLHRTDPDNQKQQIKTKKDINSLPSKYFIEGEGATYLEVRTSPPPSRQTSLNDISEIVKKQRTEWKTQQIKPLSYNATAPLFHLPSEYLAESGLVTPKKLILYCRPMFHEQFKFLQERVIENGVYGWILGPPGTGKSTTALAFASTLDKEKWTVTWIHLDRNENPICMRFEGNTIRSRGFRYTELDDVLPFYKENDNRKHLLFIDGYAYLENSDQHDSVQRDCLDWLKKDREKNRLVIVCSMTSRYKVKHQEDMKNTIEEFLVYSWKKEEYLLAVQHDDFFKTVIENLDSMDLNSSNNFLEKTTISDNNSSSSSSANSSSLLLNADSDSSVTRADLVESKFHYAGGCSRYMFLFRTTKVISELDISINTVEDIIPYIEGTVGHRSNKVINRLFSMYLIGSSRKRSWIISRHAACLLAVRFGPDLITNLAKTIAHDSNPSMDGWMFEMWFFANIREKDIELFDKNGIVTKVLTKAKIEVIGEDFPSLPTNKGIWLKPKKWNQGGYDALFVDKSRGLLRFVQVTRGSTHSFKIEHFSKFFNALMESPSSFKVKEFEIVFAVDFNKIDDFKISSVTGEGLLRSVGWEKGHEKGLVETLGMKGMDEPA